MHAITSPIQEQVCVAVYAYIVENFLFGDPGGLTHDASLIEAGALDSTGVIELVGFLEETFGIGIRDQDLIPDNFDSIDRIGHFVVARLRDPAQQARS
jgi:acyl carrier protein